MKIESSDFVNGRKSAMLLQSEELGFLLFTMNVSLMFSIPFRHLSQHMKI